MKIITELILFCGLFTLMVKMAAGNDGLNALYFYPREFQNIAYERKLADRENVRRERKSFLIVFTAVMTAALVGIVHFNQANSFKEAYLQSLLFLEVMNWYDGIVIDRIWVGNSKLWKIRGMEDIPYLQSWIEILRKRVILSVIWVILAVLAAGIVMMIGGIK